MHLTAGLSSTALSEILPLGNSSINTLSPPFPGDRTLGLIRAYLVGIRVVDCRRGVLFPKVQAGVALLQWESLFGSLIEIGLQLIPFL